MFDVERLAEAHYVVQQRLMPEGNYIRRTPWRFLPEALKNTRRAIASDLIAAYETLDTDH